MSTFCTKCGFGNEAQAKFCGGCGAVMPGAGAAAAPAAVAAGGGRYAGFWIRTLAAIIDSMLLQLVTLVAAVPLLLIGLAASGDEDSALAAALIGVFYLLSLVLNWLWFTLSESSKWQASPGKKILGLKVTDEQGARIGFGKANGRYWSKLLSGMLFLAGFLMVGFTERKQGLHDKLAGTLVSR